MDTIESHEYAVQWKLLLRSLEKAFGKSPDVESILFLIGVQELGKGPASFTREQKQDLMQLATCRLLSQCGIYTYQGTDTEGWPVYTQVENLPKLSFGDQERMLKIQILEYFKEINWHFGL